MAKPTRSSVLAAPISKEESAWLDWLLLAGLCTLVAIKWRLVISPSLIVVVTDWKSSIVVLKLAISLIVTVIIIGTVIGVVIVVSVWKSTIRLIIVVVVSIIVVVAWKLAIRSISIVIIIVVKPSALIIEYITSGDEWIALSLSLLLLGSSLSLLPLLLS